MFSLCGKHEHVFIYFRTAGSQGVTKMLSEVKTNVLITPNFNYIEDVEVELPVGFHSKSILISELVVLSFIPHTKCMLTSLFFNQSLRRLTEAGTYKHYVYYK